MSNGTEMGFKSATLGITTRKYIPDHIFYVTARRKDSRNKGRRERRKPEEKTVLSVPMPTPGQARGRGGRSPAWHLISSAQQSKRSV